MPTFTPIDDFSQEAPAHRVYFKQFWGDAWEEVDYLYAILATHSMNPSLPSAVFTWKYGVGIQAPGNVQPAVFTPYEDILNSYVRLEVDFPDETIGTWHGFIWEVLDSRLGARVWPPGSGTRVLSGEQQFVAYGLESFLDRHFLQSSWVQDHTSSTSSEYKIKRALPFNDELVRKLPAEDQNLRRNRSQTKGDKDAYIFTDDPDEADEWTTKDIVEYLLAYHMPTDQDDTEILEWELAGDNVLPDWDRPEKECHGRSIKSILDELIDRRRALGWWVELEDEDRDAASPKLIVHVCSFTSVLVSMPGGGNLQPNPSIYTTMDFDLAKDVVLAPLKESAAHQVDQVVVVGERIRSCFSMSYLDDTLDRGWTDDQENAYILGGSPDVALDISEQQRIVENARKRDELDPVYSHFVLPENWNGEVGDGIGGDLHPFLPDEVNEDLGEDDGPEQFFRPGLRLLNFLPFKLVRDGTELGGEVVAGVAYAQLLCLILVDSGEDEEDTEDDVYQHMERLASVEGLEGEEVIGFEWSATTQPLDKDAGVAITVNNAPQHIFSEGSYGTGESPAAAFDRTPELSWQDNLILTVFMACDRHVTQHHPPDDELELTDVVKRTYIDLGDKAHLDYVAPNTVVGIDDEGHLVHDNEDGYWIRDDRKMMLDLATLAYEWYQLPRVSLRIAHRLTNYQLRVGEFIETIGAGSTLREVNCVITSLTWDLEHGQTEVVTEFSELDFAGLLGALGAPGAPGQAGQANSFAQATADHYASIKGKGG